MFRKKEIKKSTSVELQKEAKKFQDAVSEINANYSPDQINLHICEAVAQKNEIGVESIAEAFEVFLRNNAIRDINKLKESGDDHAVVHLEKIAESYGFDLESLNISYF